MSEERAVAAGVMRFVLTVALGIMVYREAGPWTAIALGLIALGLETQLRLVIGENNE